MCIEFLPFLVLMLSVATLIDSTWGYIHQNYSEFHIFVTWSIGIHMAVFWPITLVLMYVDITQSPQFLYKYKIQKVSFLYVSFTRIFTRRLTLILSSDDRTAGRTTKRQSRRPSSVKLSVTYFLHAFSMVACCKFFV